MESSENRLRIIAGSSWLAWAIAAAGIILRLRQYLFNRALRVDEAYLALNIFEKNFTDFFGKLAYDQAAPPGFLILEKISVLTAGISEQVLRFWPVAFGCIGLVLFTAFARRAFRPRTAFTAVLLFAISPTLTFYASELKPYSLDAGLAVFFIWLAWQVKDRELSVKWSGVLAFAGVFGIWFSYPLVFTLAAVAVFLLMEKGHSSRKQVIQMGAIFLAWAVSFAVFFLVSKNAAGENPYLVSHHSENFMPALPFSTEAFRWYLQNFFNFFQKPVGLFSTGLAGCFFIIGIRSLWKEKKSLLTLLLVPIICVLGASALGKYPFAGRLILFLSPAGCAVIAKGITDFSVMVKNTSRLAAWIFPLMIFIHPGVSAAYRFLKPVEKEELRKCIRFISENGKKGNAVYVYYASEPAYRYYAFKRKMLTGAESIFGIMSRKDWSGYEKDVKRLPIGKQAWLLFSHAIESEKKFMLHLVGKNRKRLKSIKTEGASAYLFSTAENPDK